MEAMIARVLLLIFGLLLTCGCTVYGGGFSVEFIHRDSAKSPFHDPALSPHDRVLAAVRRSTARAAALTSSSDDVGSTVISRSFEYLMAVNVGTPPRHLLAIADTGSDLVWIRCGNGSADHRAPAAAAAPTPVSFDPSGSKTFGRVSCQTDACQAVPDATCDADSNCQYLYAYGDGSRTSGLLSTETFTFDVAGAREGGSRQVSVANVNFGCSTVATGTFEGDGLVGLGAGAISLVTQLDAATKFGRKFSYCLVPHSVNSSSTINFGAHANVSEPGAATTPLVNSNDSAYYTVTLESVKVGERAVAAQRSPIIVDSGTTLTFLDEALVSPLVEELSRRITLPRAQSPDKLLHLCYNVSGAQDPQQWGIPDVTLELGGGAAVTLRAENTFVLVQEGTLCLGLVSTSDGPQLAILGNIAQQNFHVGYDLDARTVTFAAADCARTSSS